MSALVCVCGCPQGRHLLARRDCKSCPDCTQFRAAATVALDVGALLGEVQGDVSRESELADRLAEAERDRDRLDRALRDLAGERDEWRERASHMEKRAVDQLAATVRAQRELADLSEAMPCGWCSGIGVAPEERFGRDADGAPIADGPQPCPQGCEVADWLQAERNDAADDARLLAEARQEIERLGVVLEHAEQYARDLQDDGVVPAGTVVVLFAYDAWQCLDGSVNCSRRYYADDPEHACGPLTPVTVTVSRRPAS